MKNVTKSSNSKRYYLIFLVALAIFSTYRVYKFRYELQQRKQSIEVIENPKSSQNIPVANIDAETTPTIVEDFESPTPILSDFEKFKYDKLSNEFIYDVEINKIDPNSNCLIGSQRIRVIDRSTEETFQIIDIPVGENALLYSKDFVDPNHCRSYLTNFNITADAIDHDFGDFIVGDFNFDGYEDFAIKIEAGGNGGPFYKYYLGNEYGFQNDKFLNDNFPHFIDSMNPTTKVISSSIHAGAGGRTISKATYDLYNEQWQFLGSKYVPYH